MSSQVDPRVYFADFPPYSIDRDILSGGTGGPVMDGSVPTGSNDADYKNRLKQILVSGAQTLLTALQYRVLPNRPTDSGEYPGKVIPGTTTTVGGADDSPVIRITGQARSFTMPGLLVLGAVVVGAIFLARR